MSKSDGSSYKEGTRRRERRGSFYIDPQATKTGTDSGKSASEMIDEFYVENNKIVVSEEAEVTKAPYDRHEKGTRVDIAEVVSRALGEDIKKVANPIGKNKSISSFRSFEEEGSGFAATYIRRKPGVSVDTRSEKKYFREKTEKETRDEYLEGNETEEFSKFVNEDSKAGESRRNFLDEILKQKAIEKIIKASPVKHGGGDDQVEFLKSMYKKNYDSHSR